jgi:hypothetical protein
MIIKKYNFFLESSNNEELEDIYSFFLDIVDMKYNYYQIRNGNGDQYKIVYDVEYKITESGNYIINIYCDYLYHYSIEEMIKNDIKPRLKEFNYNIHSIKTEITKKIVMKTLPVHDRDYFYRDFDPIYKIAVLIKKKL